MIYSIKCQKGLDSFCCVKAKQRFACYMWILILKLVNKVLKLSKLLIPLAQYIDTEMKYKQSQPQPEA